MNVAPTVLIIEDDAWFAQHHVRTLENAGFTVRHVTDGIAGMAAIDESLPDAIVLDLFLPGPNALVLLHEMQSYADLSGVPVILCSNSATDLTSNTLAAYGITDVLDKGTMRPHDLVASIKRTLV